MQFEKPAASSESSGISKDDYTVFDISPLSANELAKNIPNSVQIRAFVLAGVSVAIILYFLYSLIPDTGILGPVEESDFKTGIVAFILMFMIVVIALFTQQNKEVSHGFARVGDDDITWWTPKKIIKVPLGDIFGMTMETGKFMEKLKFYFKVKEKTGFESASYNFRYYYAVKGPEITSETIEGDGNVKVRDAVLYHLKRRKSRGHPVAKFASFKNKVVHEQKEKDLHTEHTVKSSLECDGVIVKYIKDGEANEFPVASVDDVRIHTAGRSKFLKANYAIITFRPEYHKKPLRIDLTHFHAADKLVDYLILLPTVLPDLKIHKDQKGITSI